MWHDSFTIHSSDGAEFTWCGGRGLVTLPESKRKKSHCKLHGTARSKNILESQDKRSAIKVVCRDALEASK